MGSRDPKSLQRTAALSGRCKDIVPIPLCAPLILTFLKLAISLVDNRALQCIHVPALGLSNLPRFYHPLGAKAKG